MSDLDMQLAQKWYFFLLCSLGWLMKMIVISSVVNYFAAFVLPFFMVCLNVILLYRDRTSLISDKR